MRNCEELTTAGVQCKNKSPVGICPVHLKKLRVAYVTNKAIISDLKDEVADLKKECSKEYQEKRGWEESWCEVTNMCTEYEAEIKKLKREYCELSRELKDTSDSHHYTSKEYFGLMNEHMGLSNLFDKLKAGSVPHGLILTVSDKEVLKVKIDDDNGISRNFVVVTKKCFDGVKEVNHHLIDAVKKIKHITRSPEDIREIARLKKAITKKSVTVNKPPNDNYKEIKKENEKLNKAVQSLKERVAVHSSISKVCYTYEAFDKYINDTVERITGHTRDYPAGIYNKITDFMRIKNISRICYSDLGITASDFYKQFIDLRNDRNRTCHPPLKKRDKKRVADFIVDYLN
jgi:hypothetical protein